MIKKTVYIIIGFSVFLILYSCSSYKYSYEEKSHPVFEGSFAPSVDRHLDFADSHIIKVISFNIEFANNIDEAIKLLESSDAIGSDVLLLQEMDEKGALAIAKALSRNYVYYPAINHPGIGKKVGNAILSKWPIKSHRKLKLPHPSSYPGLDFKNYLFRKIATVACIKIYDKDIFFYSMHAAAFNTTKKRGEVAQVLALDAAKQEYAIVGGDFNTLGAADKFATIAPFIENEFEWASKNIGPSVSKIKTLVSFMPKEAFVLDHLFTKGFNTLSSGKIINKKASDHYPIWIEVKIKP